MLTPDNSDYPGSAHHQRVLRDIVDYYAADARVRAVALFGSLARGDWQDASDLDLDIVVTDGVTLEPVGELTRLCDALGAIGERAAVIVASGADAGDVVLASLLEFSIRYHPLAVTSPNIVETLQVLWARDDGAGALDSDAIRAAGRAQALTPQPTPDELIARCIRYALEVDVSLRRGRLWLAIELLHRLRTLLMEMFARTHGGSRTQQTFEAQASAALQARLGATLPVYAPDSIHAALDHALDVLERDLDDLSAGQARLTDAQRAIVRQLRARQVR